MKGQTNLVNQHSEFTLFVKSALTIVGFLCIVPLLYGTLKLTMPPTPSPSQPVSTAVSLHHA